MFKLTRKEKINKLSLTINNNIKADCPKSTCPIIRDDNGESYCSKCDYIN